MSQDAEEQRRLAAARLSSEVFSEPDALGRPASLRGRREPTRIADASFETGPGWRIYVPAGRLPAELQHLTRELAERFPGLETELTSNGTGELTLEIRFDDTVAQSLHVSLTSDECLRVEPSVLDRIWLPEGYGRHRLVSMFKLRSNGRYVVTIDSRDDGNYACWPVAVPLIATLVAQLEQSFAKETSVPIEPGQWPNESHWSALHCGPLSRNDQRWDLFVVDCGELCMPSGKLVVCDPFADMRRNGNASVRTPSGRFPVRVTVADVSPKQDRSDLREAYTTLVLRDEPESHRRGLALLQAGEPIPLMNADEFIGFRVDSGTACFVDEAALQRGMPENESSWLSQLFENERPDSWFKRMDSAAHLRPGLANIPLPLATDGSNLVLFHSGWGDGIYPVVGGYASDGTLVRVHVDFGVVR